MKLNDLTSEKWEFIIDHPVKQSQGVYLYYKGIPYPRRVYYSRLKDLNYNLRSLEALGTVKKFLFSLTYLSNLVIPRTLNIKKYERFLEIICGLCMWELSEFILEDDEWSEPVWEIGKLIKNFLTEFGFNNELCTRFSQIGMVILEFDNAYRYRVQDLLGEIHVLNRRTLDYILRLYKEREGLPGAAQKINKIGNLFKWLLWIPKIKRALKNAQQGIDFSKIRLDENDRFHTSFWIGYDYGGLTFNERFAPYEEIYKKAPFNKLREKVIANFMTE